MTKTHAITGKQRDDILTLLEDSTIGHEDFRKTADILQYLPLITGEPCNEDLAINIECIDARHRGDPSYEHDAYYMRIAAAKLIRTGYQLYTHAQPLPKGEPKAWLIKFKDTDGTQRSRSYTHNAIGDYRQIDPNATSEELFTHAQPLQPITELEAWKDAVLDALATTCTDAPVDKSPRDIIHQVIDWYVTLTKSENNAQPLQPITADDVTDEMVTSYHRMANEDYGKDIIVNAFKAWFKHKGNTNEQVFPCR